ncbi:MAG: hypothetical protein NZ949_07615, partial [Candidatus Kapabacteria bacterium]|nr:hypothetical protein [Candidatus Kapabacteria bacterium]
MHHGFYSRYIYSFVNGASQPPSPVAYIAASNTTANLLDGTQLGDLDGDGQRELVMPHHRTVPPSITVVSPHLGWSVVTRTLAPHPPDLFAGEDRIQMIVTDTVPGGGHEVIYRGRRTGTSYAFLIHASITPPSYTVASTWHYTFSVDTNPNVFVLDLDGGNREVLASYTDAQGELRTRLFSATGSSLSDLSGMTLCYSGNLDGDAFAEVVFCDRRVNDALRARAYEWNGSAWTPTWPSSITVYSLAPTPLGLDLNGDGIQDLLAYNPARTRLQSYSGANGALLSEFTFPTDVDCSTQVRSPMPPRIVLSCSNGFLYVLDNTLNATAVFYAGTGSVGPYVVDTDANGKNELVLVNGSGALVNLDPYTATQ